MTLVPCEASCELNQLLAPTTRPIVADTEMGADVDGIRAFQWIHNGHGVKLLCVCAVVVVAFLSGEGRHASLTSVRHAVAWHCVTGTAETSLTCATIA